MITARQFEDKIIEIKQDYKDDPDTLNMLLDKLVYDTLDCVGYTAGARLYIDIKTKE